MAQTEQKRKLSAALAALATFFRPTAQEIVDEGVQEARKTPTGKIVLAVVVAGLVLLAAYVGAAPLVA